VSFTEVEQIFAGVNESGLNDFLTAFFSARPHYLNYGSVPFVPATTATVTQVDTISFPGVSGGIPYIISFSIPKIDLYPDSSGGTAPVPINPGQLSIRTTVRLIVGCARRNDNPDIPRTYSSPVSLTPVSTSLDVWAVGRPTLISSSGTQAVGIAVDAIEIVDITPDSLESVLECLILTVLRAVLANVQLPIRALRAGAFSLTLTRGPETEDDQEKLYGAV
jgi:hypothetical protein